MTLPQSQPYTRGQFIDGSRDERRHLIYPGVIKTWEITAALVETGLFSYKVNGVLVSYAAAVPPDDATVIAAGLVTNHINSAEAFRIANATSALGVVTVRNRSALDPSFDITDTTSPGLATLVAVDVTPAIEELPLGIACAMATDGTLRQLAPGDTAASVIGIIGASGGSELKLNTGDPSQDDVYETGACVDYLAKGEIPVQVETAIALGDPVHVRATATGAEVFGAFRNAADGGDTFQLTNARWTTASYFDGQGRQTAILLVNQP